MRISTHLSLRDFYTCTCNNVAMRHFGLLESDCDKMVMIRRVLDFSISAVSNHRTEIVGELPSRSLFAIVLIVIAPVQWGADHDLKSKVGA
jgi:hypothetical protein